ncbi:hypothetical protein [Streptomyces sp. NPDC097981]|uniref:hypothetical protein n=1 Tax=Streptomyces sp. NPDC097981 TaxID=3155428 RepID=UPI003324BA12
MTSRTMPRCTREVLSIDTPDTECEGIHAVAEPSPELLDRALVGWERLLGSQGPCDG